MEKLAVVVNNSNQSVTPIEMIDAIKEEERTHKFIEILATDDSKLKKKTAYIQTIDDLVDAYWCYKTTMKKEDLE